MKSLLRLLYILISIPLVSLGYWIFVAVLELIPPVNELIKYSERQISFTPIILVLPYALLLFLISKRAKGLFNKLKNTRLIKTNQKAVIIGLVLIVFLLIAFLIGNYIQIKNERHNQTRQAFEILVKKLEISKTEKGRYPTFGEFREKGDINPLFYTDCESLGISEAVLSTPLDPPTIYNVIFSGDRKVTHLVYRTKNKVIKEENMRYGDTPQCITNEQGSSDFEKGISIIEDFKNKNGRYPLWIEVESLGLSTKMQFNYFPCFYGGGGNVILAAKLSDDELLYYTKTKARETVSQQAVEERTRHICDAEQKDNFESGIKVINDFYKKNQRHPTQQEVTRITVIAPSGIATGNSYLTCSSQGKQQFTLSYTSGKYTNPSAGIKIPSVYYQYRSLVDKIDQRELADSEQSLPLPSCP